MSGLVGLHQLLLELDDGGDVRLALLERSRQRRLVDLGGTLFEVAPGLLGPAGFDHHHGDVAAVELTPGNHDLEGGGITLGVGGMCEPFTVGGVGEAHSTDGTVERDAREHQRS